MPLEWNGYIIDVIQRQLGQSVYAAALCRCAAFCLRVARRPEARECKGSGVGG